MAPARRRGSLKSEESRGSAQSASPPLGARGRRSVDGKRCRFEQEGPPGIRSERSFPTQDHDTGPEPDPPLPGGRRWKHGANLDAFSPHTTRGRREASHRFRRQTVVSGSPNSGVTSGRFPPPSNEGGRGWQLESRGSGGPSGEKTPGQGASTTYGRARNVRDGWRSRREIGEPGDRQVIRQCWS